MAVRIFANHHDSIYIMSKYRGADMKMGKLYVASWHEHLYLIVEDWYLLFL